MALSEADIIEVNDVIIKHTELYDSGELHRLGEVYDQDVSYNLTLMGGICLKGLDAVIEAAHEWRDRIPVAYHVTNVVLAPIGEYVSAKSMGVGVDADGNVNKMTYEDIIAPREQGWRITYREFRPHTAPQLEELMQRKKSSRKKTSA